MRILLISPPYRRFMGILEDSFRLGLGYIGAILDEAGHFVRIYNADFDKNIEPFPYSYKHSFSHQQDVIKALSNDNHYVWKEIKGKIESFSPDIVGISTMTNKYAMALKIAEITKRVNREIKVVVGGHHPTLFPDGFLGNKDIDFVVRGEGEETFFELVKEIENEKGQFSQIDGLSFRKNGEICHNRNRMLIPNLDILSYPNRELLVDKEYYSSIAFSGIITARGCPFSCTYCGAHNMWGRKVRFRSVDNIMGEILMLLKKYNSEHIFFLDDSFTLNKKRIEDLCSRLTAINNYRLKWSCYTRLDLIDEGFLQQMQESGCQNIWVGVESGSREMLKLVNKGLTLKEIEDRSKMVKKSRIQYSTFFMMGLPGETKDQIFETYNFMKKIEPVSAEINIFNPLPGTKLCKHLQETGVLPQDIKWEKFSQESIENFYTKGMNKEEFEMLALEMAERFDRYNRNQGYKRELKERKWQLAEAHTALGGFYLKHSQSRKAICEIKKAIKVDSMCILAQYHLGSYYQNKGDLKKAIECFKKTLQINTTKKKIYWAGAHFHLGEIYQALGKIDKAELEFKECLRYNPKHRRAKENLRKRRL